MNDNYFSLRQSVVSPLAMAAVCIFCGFSAYGSDFHDDVFKYVEYYDEPDGSKAVVVDGIYKFPSDGILNLPSSITVNEENYKVVGWDGGTYIPESGPCTKLILPDTFRELGVTVSGVYVYTILNGLIDKGLKEIEVNPANPWFKSQEGMLLSADGKKLYYISDALAAAPDLVIPEGVEFIYPSLNVYEPYGNYAESRRSIILPASLKYTAEIYSWYPFIILKSEKAPESIDYFMHGSDPESSYKHNGTKVYVPKGSLESYRYSTIWGYANSTGWLKEMDMTSEKGKNVKFNFNFSRREEKPIIKVNNKTATDSYTAEPMEPVVLEITSYGDLDYFNDNAWPDATCEPEDLGNDRRRYTYVFYPEENSVISAGQTQIYGGAEYLCQQTYDGVRLIEYHGDDNVGNLSIPSTVTLGPSTYDVTELGDGLYSGRNIRHITFPASLKRIGAGCFDNVSIQELNLPEGLEEIGDGAFSNNKNLRDVTLPTSITKLSYRAFGGCDLRSCNIPAGFRGYGRSVYDDNPFFINAGGEDGLIDLIIIDASDETFGCNVAPAKKLVVNRTWYPTIVTAEEAEFNSKKAELDMGAFSKGNPALLQKISVRSDECEITGKLRISGRWQSRCDMEYGLKEINIESSSLKIGDGAFAALDRLSTVQVRTDGGEGLGESAFDHCRALTDISLTGIGGGFMTAAFRDCDKLESIHVNEGIDYISGIAFQRCGSLKRVEFEYSATPVVIGTGAFDDCPIEEIYLDRDITDPEPTFFRTESLTRLEIGSNITRIPDYAFADCRNLRGIYCESATPPTIGYNTFRNVPTDKCRVYVKGGDGEYREAGGWKDFFPVSGVTGTEDSSISVTAADGVLTVRGADGKRVTVYSVSAMRAFFTESASDTETIALNAGLYIVVVGNKTFKINLK